MYYIKLSYYRNYSMIKYIQIKYIKYILEVN